MPAASVLQGDFVATAGQGTQADAGANTAPATRYKIRLINTHATDRLYVAFSQAVAVDTSPNPEVIEADFGVWDAFIEAGVQVWVRPEAANSINVRVIQYAT